FPIGRSCFLVAEEGGVVEGIVTLHNVKSVPQSRWGVTQLREIIIPIDKLKTAYPEQDALSILEQMDESSVSQMPVVSQGRVIGLVTRDNLIMLLRTRSALGVR
ncbi:CBS domain-containing protein, partial [Chloroflexota bacterium]